MHGEIDLLHRVLVLACDRELVDELGRVGPDDVCAEDLTVLGVANDLHEAVGLAAGASAPVRREGELPDLVLELLVLALLLGEADRRYFGMTVGGVRNVAIVHRMHVLAGELLSERDALSRALVGEHWRTGDIADRENAFGRCAE